MDRTSSDWSKSSYVSCMKINGKPIIRPLMTPERRAEMGHYRQLAMAVEARLQGWTKRNCGDERNSVDSGVTMLSSTQQTSSDHMFTNRRVGNESAGEIESRLTISGDSESLNGALINRLVSCSGLEQRILKTVRNADVRSGSASTLGSCQVLNDTISVIGPTQQNVVHGNSGEMENKCGLENMEQSSGFSVNGNIFSSNYTGYNPWEKVHNIDNNNDCNKVLKPQQENISVVISSRQGSEQASSDGNVNGNLVQNSQQRWDKNGIQHCLVHNFITPIIQNVILKSRSLINGTDDHGQNYTSDPRGESVNYQPFVSQNEIQTKNPFEHIQLQPEGNSTFFLHSQKAEKPSVPGHGLSCLGKEVYASDDISKPVKNCEGVMDISKGLQSGTCGNEDCVRFNTWESDSRATMNKCSFSRHSSPESTVFSGLADVSSSTPHLVTHENLEDSVSSAAMTSSTDLNHYMNTTGSSSSGSPGRDLATLHTCKWSGQDVLHSTANIAALQRPLMSRNCASGQNLRLASFSESNLILHHSSLTDRIEAQKYIQNVVTDKLGTSLNKDNVCVVKKLVVQDDSSDLKVNCSKGCLGTADCKSADFGKTCKNVNCHVADEAKCLTVPNLTLQLNKSADKHDDLETSAIPVNKGVHGSHSAERNLKKTEFDVLKPEATPPRLVRQNSYTLESPSPLLVAHMETQKENDSFHDMTESSYISPKPCRKAWDLTKAKSRWESNSKKNNSLFAVPNMKAKSSKKINSYVTSSFRRGSLSGLQNRHNSSLPGSNTSSPVKLQTPFASLDCLPSAFSQPSTPRKNKGNLKDSISSAAAKETSRNKTSQRKSPAKSLRTNSSMENLSIASQENLKKVSEVESVPSSSQQDVRGLILRMQSEHSQQMAELLAKQRKEQEELREDFLRQQNELVLEIGNVHTPAFSMPESRTMLSQQTSSCDYLLSHENGNFNTSINLLPSDLSSKNLLMESADTVETSTHDTRDRCLSSDTNLERFETSISALAEKERNATGNSLYQDASADKTRGSNNEMTGCLQESDYVNASGKEVSPSSFENCSSLRLSGSDNTKAYFPVFLSDSSISRSKSTQVLVTLQKHNSDSGEANTKDNTLDISPAVFPLLPTSPGAVLGVPASGTVSVPLTMDYSLQSREMDFPSSIVSSSPPMCIHNSVMAKERQTERIQDRSTCIRQLFPTHGQAGALYPVSRSELEKIAATRITAAARGFLTRRLFRTARVQDLILTIRDTLLCAMQLNQDCWPDVTPEDVALHRRLIQQVTAACYALHEVFFSLSISEQMTIIGADRERIRNQTPRLQLPRPLSTATKRAIERKMLQSHGGCVPRNRPMSAGCSLHRIKSAGIDKRTHSGMYDVGQSCILRQQQQQAQLQGVTKTPHSFNMNGGRKPWR